MSLREKQGSVFSASFFLAATTVGTGIFAIPIISGTSGFWPAVCICVLSWAYIISCSLLYMEVILALPEEYNLTSYCKKLLGPVGVGVATLTFLITNYLFLASYYSAGNLVFEQVGIDLSPLSISIVLLLLTALVIFLGIYISDRVCLIFFGAAILSFLAILFLGASRIAWERLVDRNWYYIFFAIAALANSLGAQAILPPLARHVGRKRSACAKVVIYGASLPFVMVVLWQWFVIGVTDKSDLWTAFELNTPTSSGMFILKNAPLLQILLNFFSLFAIFTSMIGIGLATTDFWRDCFKIPLAKCRGGLLLLLLLLVLVPPLLLGDFFVTFTFNLLNNVGGWTVIILNGVVPVWLVFSARYFWKISDKPLLFGGKTVLAILLLVIFFLTYLQGIELIGIYG